MKKENCYLNRFISVLVHECLLQKARRHLNLYDRRAQLGAFNLIWTAHEGNSIADLCNNKNLN